MKKTVLIIIIYIAVCLIIPYLITMLMTGICESKKTEVTAKTVILNHDNVTEITDVTDYIIRTVGAYYEAEDSTEFLKAMAIVVRTYVKYVQEDKVMANSAAIAMTTLSEKEMKTLWGNKYDEYYSSIKLAVNETSNMTMTFNDKTILPYFHEMSAGRTRNGAEDYLQSVICSEDMVAEKYIHLTEIPAQEVKKTLNDKFNSANCDLYEMFQIISRDEAGYVEEIMAGNVTLTGEDIVCALKLDSSCFTVAVKNDKFVFTSKGRGSGYGMSLHCARKKAAEGYNFQDILFYFYKNIQIKNE